jgi:hypothetical protein
MPNFVQELTKDDVLLGRGTGPNEYQGNIRFRALVKETLRSNELKKSSNGSTKTMLARMIVRDVKAQNGRFLKKVGKSSTGRDLFAVVPDRVAVDKTRQSFRHQLKSIENRKPKTPVGRGDPNDFFLDSVSGSSEKLSATKANSMILLPKAKVLSARKESEAKRSPALASGPACSSLRSLLGLMDHGSPPVPPRRKNLMLCGDEDPPPSFRSSSSGSIMIPSFDASIEQRVACFNQQHLERLAFPPSLGNEVRLETLCFNQQHLERLAFPPSLRNEVRLERRMPFYSPNSALDRFRFGLFAPEHASRDLALDLILLRVMTTEHY